MAASSQGVAVVNGPTAMERRRRYGDEDMETGVESPFHLAQIALYVLISTEVRFLQSRRRSAGVSFAPRNA